MSSAGAAAAVRFVGRGLGNGLGSVGHGLGLSPAASVAGGAPDVRITVLVRSLEWYTFHIRLR